MKKVILTTIIALVTVVSAFAQGAGSSSDVAVTATVNAALTLTPTPVAFGIIQASLASYIPANASDLTAEANTGTGSSVGALQIQGTTGANVTVTWGTGTLTNGTGDNPTTFTPTVYLATAEVTSGDDDITIAGGDITLNVGGALAAIANPGTYSTGNTNGLPVTFSVIYTNI